MTLTISLLICGRCPQRNDERWRIALADPPHPTRRLRTRRERPRGGRAEQRDERAPLHSITLVGTGEQQERFRDRQPEPLGGGQIDDEIELGRLFNRKLARLGAAQDLVDVVDLRRRLSNLHPPPGPGISVDRSVDRIAARANSTSFVHDFSYLAR